MLIAALLNSYHMLIIMSNYLIIKNNEAEIAIYDKNMIRDVGLKLPS